MRRLVVSKRAETDLRGIWLYSLETWGEEQADCYLDELDARGGLRRAAEGQRRTDRRRRGRQRRTAVQQRGHDRGAADRNGRFEVAIF
jgi:plasmid stabilization system protein ParE